jgi:hypothetical protein
MNKRIDAIAEQAKQYANSYGELSDPSWFPFYNEKFAELIVNECGKLALECAYPAEAAVSMKRDSTAFIAKHFGVK